MRLDTLVLLTILGMSLVTYLTRAGGYALFRVLRPGPRMQGFLGYVPGAMFVAYVVPGLAQGRLPEWSGAAVTVVAMLSTHNLALAVLGGTGVAWAVWAWA